jgi:hypothetical protein
MAPIKALPIELLSEIYTHLPTFADTSTLQQVSLDFRNAWLLQRERISGALLQQDSAFYVNIKCPGNAFSSLHFRDQLLHLCDVECKKNLRPEKRPISGIQAMVEYENNLI